MSGIAKSLKRKVEDCQDDGDDESRATKEAKWDLSAEGNLHDRNSLNLLRLQPEDWDAAVTFDEQDNDDAPVELREGLTSRGTSWRRKDSTPYISGVPSVLSLSCKRILGQSASIDCETQTCYFVPDPASSVSDSSLSKDEIKKKNLVKVCCVLDCKNELSKCDSPSAYYSLPSSECERLLWADILDVKFADASDVGQEICSKHFIACSDSASMICSPSKATVSQPPKTKTRKKKTCDILIAEEAEKVKQGMTTGRSKRTPKPNRNYDWAELIPLIKNERDELEDLEPPPPPARVSTGLFTSNRYRKTPIDRVFKEEKENERPYMEATSGLISETDTLDGEVEDYGIDISLPSIPRAPPPKPKGRRHKIQDSCAQTDGNFCPSRGPLREVKVQCNLTGEAFSTCSSCSNIDWKSLDEMLMSVSTVIEGDLCNPMIMKTIKKFVSTDSSEASHALNVLKMLSGQQRDELEIAKDIVLVSGDDDLEVEIDNVIHQEEAPMSGMREIIPKVWNKKAKIQREVLLNTDEVLFEDQDSLGLREATDRDDEEFQPDCSTHEEEEEDDEVDIDDDEDWDVKAKDDLGSLLPRKKKGRQKVKKEQALEAAPEQGSSHTLDNKEENPLGNSDKTSLQQNRRRRCGEGDTRWIRQEHQCKECNEVFSTKRKYELHYRHVHLGVPPWHGSHQCDDCGKTFTQKITLNIHRMFKHGAPRRFHCTICTYVGPTKEYLKRHMRVHTGERRYECKECGKGLKSLDTYRNHMVIHTNKGRFFCQLCKKAYNHKGAFADHMQSHQENRDFVCYCGATFKVYKHIARHIRAVHLNDKRFICDICGAQHMSGYNLKSHLKKHGDLSFLPYSFHCSGCDVKFRGSQGYAAHMRVIHKTEESKLPTGEVVEKPLLTIHPTRRPVAVSYQYSHSPDNRESDGTAVSIQASQEPVDSLVDCEDFVITEVKSVDEKYSTCEVKLETNGEDEDRDPSSSGMHIIQVFSCSECSSMFTSETLCREHMNEAHT